jgi:hypothetical protein
MAGKSNLATKDPPPSDGFFREDVFPIPANWAGETLGPCGQKETYLDNR